MAIANLDPFLVGEKVTATKLTASTKGAIESAVHYKPFVHIANLTGTAIPVGNNALTLDDLIEDTDQMTVGQTGGRVIVRTAGLYRVTAQVTYGFGSGGYRGLNIYRNGIQWVSPKVAPNPETLPSPGRPTTVQWTFTGRFTVNETMSVSSESNANHAASPAGGADGQQGHFLQMEWVSK